MLAILGPTGTGKSELACRLAERLGGEVIGCDALQIYRGLDAATAKPAASQRRRVPHHLIDEVDPRERDYSLAEYVRRADERIADLAARGKVPIVAGGTGLYLRGLLRGIVVTPPRDEALRRRLRAIAARRGAAALHRWLRRLDPESAQRLSPGDTQRVVRGLELALVGRRTWSRSLAEEGSWASGGERYDALKVGLRMEREPHLRILGERVDRFFAAGLVDEVRRLLDEGLSPEANALKAIGYREVVAALRAGTDPDATRAEVKRRTRRYAKRQLTWFRREPDVVWLDASLAPSSLVERVLALWSPAG